MISNRKVALTLLAFYILAAVLYGLTLELTSNWTAGMLWQRMTLDYGLKAIVSAPLVYLVFGIMRRRSEAPQVALTILMALPFAFAWQLCYYAVGDLVGVGHMGGAGAWWDIYIPLLVYCIQFLILFSVQYHNRTVAAVQRAERLASLAESSELAALKAQVNPHFLFNTFNAISASLPPEQEETRELLAKLADLFRYQVVASQREFVALSGELSFIEDYLSLSQVRMGERLRYHVVCDPGVDTQTSVPPMLLQPLVENAIVHGLSPKLAGGHVEVRVRSDAEGLHFVVEDDGVGFDESRLPPPDRGGTGVGLNNSRRRLDLMYQAQLVVSSQIGAGTQIRYTLPLNLSPSPLRSIPSNPTRQRKPTHLSPA